MTQRIHALTFLAALLLASLGTPAGVRGQSPSGETVATVRSQGDRAYQEGRLLEAERLYRKAAQMNEQQKAPDDADLLASLGLTLIRLDRAEDSAPLMRRALQANPGNWKAVYGQVRLLLARKSWQAAKGNLDQAAGARNAKTEDDFQYALALYYLGTDNAFEGEKAALQALYLDPADPEHVSLVSRIYTERGDLKLAVDAFEQSLLQIDKAHSAPILTELGRLYQSQREYNKARDRYVAAVKADSTFVPALKNFADLLKVAKQYGPAASLYGKYLKKEPKDVDALVGLAQSYLEIGQADQAAKVAKEALGLTSSRADARRTFIRAGLRGTDAAMRSAAATAFLNSAADTTWTVDDWVSLAEYQRGLKQYDEARATMQRGTACVQNSPQVPFELGMISLSAGDAADAIAQFQRAIAIKPDGASYHLNLGIAYLNDNRRDEGIAAIRQSVKVDDKYTAGRLMLAQTLAAADSVSAAEGQYQAILAYEPKNARALTGLGWVRLRRGDYTSAAQTYRAATESEPGNVEAWAGLGSALVGAGDLAKAAEALNKAKSIDAQNPTVKKGFELLEGARKQSGQSG